MDLLDSVGKPDKEQQARIRRAAEALRLSIYLHETGALTQSYAEEALRMTMKFSPPGEAGHRTAFVQLWVYFTKDELLPNWHTGGVADDVPANLAGDDVDALLVELAARYRVPLISHEGYGKSPGRKKRRYLLQQAAARSVQVVEASQFYAGHLRAPAIEGFMHRFHARMQSFHQGQKDYHNAQRVLREVYEVYAKLLNATSQAHEFEEEPQALDDGVGTS